mgnify:CR=1 FL=1
MSSITRSARRAYARRVMERAGIPHPCRKNPNYENTSFFHNQFRARYQCSPFKWRKIRKDGEADDE